MGRIEFETTSCCICGSSKNQAWLEELRDRWHPMEERFTLVHCRDCGHAYLNPRPTAATLHLCYPSDYQPFQESRPSLSGWLKDLVLTRELGECHRHARPPASVLEIGCAHGAFLKKLRHAGFHVHGIETDPSASEAARQHGLDVRTGSLENARFADASLDLVYMKHVIEHLADVRGTLAEISRILKPGGRLMIATPSMDSPLIRWFGRDALDLDVPRHLNLFTGRELRRLMEEAGLGVLSLQHDPVPNPWVRSCHLRWESHAWARLFFRLENPIALLMFAPLSILFAVLGRSSRVRLWARKPTASP